MTIDGRAAVTAIFTFIFENEESIFTDSPFVQKEVQCQ